MLSSSTVCIQKPLHHFRHEDTLVETEGDTWAPSKSLFSSSDLEQRTRSAWASLLEGRTGFCRLEADGI